MYKSKSTDDVLAKAMEGDPEAQNEMGRRSVALGGADGRARAEQWFGQAAAQGLPKAMHNLGVLHWRDDIISEVAYPK